ncbi:unnamed protein product [Didymodactylos carnosus]|uniref:Hint domain-containing protein n=1 Tax=Didymodactylos carnosus TaxID=1234261 RepID=A0A8S2PF12_9BILA|nr:unnamed protein product [Didymodactylos carnosus]CAF4050300.1 unnamed protein product [Didymodactylos carnosus]
MALPSLPVEIIADAYQLLFAECEKHPDLKDFVLYSHNERMITFKPLTWCISDGRTTIVLEVLALAVPALQAAVNSTSALSNKTARQFGGGIAGPAVPPFGVPVGGGVVVGPSSDMLESMFTGGSDNCLSGDGLVQMAPTAEYKRVEQLKSGDIVLAMSRTNKITESEIIMISHSSADEYTLFTRIETENGETISLTPRHLVPIMTKDGAPSFIYAERVTPNDYVYVRDHLNNHELMCVKVKSVTAEVKMGYYSPITTKGTLALLMILLFAYSH